MNILFILSHYPGFGGIEKVSTYIAMYLARQGNNITVLSYGTNISSLICTVPKEIRLKFLPNELDYKNAENTGYIRDYLRKNTIDFIILQDSYAPLEHLLTEIDYPWNKKLIVVEHNSPLYQVKTINSYFYYNNGLIFFLERLIKYPASIIQSYIASRKRRIFLLKHCRRYVLLSDSFIRDLQLLVGCKYNAKVCAIKNPLTIQSGKRDDYSLFKKKQILFVGRFTNQKGILFLLRIWKEFSKLNTDNWELVLLGAGPEKKDIEKFIVNEQLIHIRIDEPTSEIQKYYEESSILVMTSIYEGFPLILAEAMSRGCIPMAFDSFSSVHDIITNGSNGFLVKPFSIKKYAFSLSKLVNDKNLRIKLAQKAVETSKQFDVEMVCLKWMNLFNELKKEL